jgi:iron-sulfur cluster assembly protein
MSLSVAAVSQLRSLLSQPDPKLIRVGVKNRGCSGLAYHLEYVDRPGKFDETVEQDGVKVLIDSKALFSIIGSEMDWTEDKLSRRFVFKNPNISMLPSRRMDGKWLRELELTGHWNRGAVRVWGVIHGIAAELALAMPLASVRSI